MWASAHRDGRPDKYRWRPLSNAAKFGWRPVPCSNAANTRNPLKCAEVPQTGKPISPASGPKFTVLRKHLEEILLFNNLFPIVDTCLSCEDIARQSCAMVRWWRFLRNFCVLYFQRAACRTFSDMHSKFALRPHHVSRYGRHPMRDLWDYKRKKEETRRKRKKIELKPELQNIMVPITMGGHDKFRLFLQTKMSYSCKYWIIIFWRKLFICFNIFT